MDSKRYRQLNSKESDRLTQEEMKEGWHFCPEWDFLLTNYNDKEGETCSCNSWIDYEHTRVSTNRQDTESKKE